MTRLRPSVRAGLACAGVHQAVGVLGLLAAIVSEGCFEGVAGLLAFADLPAFMVIGQLTEAGLITEFDWDESGAGTALGILWHFRGQITTVLTLGALQWFLAAFALAEAVRLTESRVCKSP